MSRYIISLYILEQALRREGFYELAQRFSDEIYREIKRLEGLC